MDFTCQFQGVVTQALLSLVSCAFPSLSLSFRLSPSFLPSPSCNNTFVGRPTQNHRFQLSPYVFYVLEISQEFAYVQITSCWFEISHHQICLRQPYLFLPSALQARYVHTHFECLGTLHPLHSHNVQREAGLFGSHVVPVYNFHHQAQCSCGNVFYCVERSLHNPIASRYVCTSESHPNALALGKFSERLSAKGRGVICE